MKKNHNWRGINVEANKTVYDKLVVNRPNSININCAVCNTDGEAEFYCNSGGTEMLSGLKNNYDPRHLNRVENENNYGNLTPEIINVKTKKIETICDEYKITHIDYLSIDVEGAEFEVIKSINFEKVFIDVIEFENNYNDLSIPIIEYLKGKDYIILNSHHNLDIFMIHKNSRFL